MTGRATSPTPNPPFATKKTLANNLMLVHRRAVTSAPMHHTSAQKHLFADILTKSVQLNPLFKQYVKAHRNLKTLYAKIQFISNDVFSY